LTNTAGATTNAGQLNGGASITGGTFTQTAGGVSGGLIHSATVNANGGALDGAIGNSGTFTVGGTVTSANGFTNNALGMLTINAAGHYTIG
ncbi:hypothetical protein, partial [Stenotrophomonas maltophilia]|uniref:hypothetical protein n=1 Tax=Stenotrophomonas maltophilia TaxID=40324 RepID=UPI0013D9FDAA